MKASVKQIQIELLATAIGDEELEEVDAANLAAIAGALRASCHDLKNINGFNLRNVLEKKLEDTPIVSPAYASLLLILCDDEAQFSQSIVEGLDNNYKTSKLCPFCVETSAVRLQALLCLKKTHPTFKKIIDSSIANNREYLKSVRNDISGSYGGLLATALAAQAIYFTSDMTKNEQQDFQKSKKYLMKHYRRQDGSFARSIQITTSVISTLSSVTLDQAKVRCLTDSSSVTEPERTSDGRKLIYVPFKIHDGVYTKQTIGVQVQTVENESLLNVLTRYANENPETIKIQTKNTNFGIRLRAINELSNDLSQRAFWRVYFLLDNKEGSRRKRKVRVSKGLDKIFIREGITYLLSFERLV